MKPINQLNKEDETLDSFYEGRILVSQTKKGYRFSVDAPLLADFIQTKDSDDLLELGTGNGVVSLLLSIKPFHHIVALEIQKSLADIARRNVKLNKLEEKITVIQKDLCTFEPSKKFDVIFSNPPYIKRMRGYLSPSLEKSIAKHELKCDIFNIMQKTAELLREEGRAYFIYPAKRREDFTLAVSRNNLGIKSLRLICARKDAPPNLFLAECNFSCIETANLVPLVLYDASGGYTEETKQIFSGRIRA